MDRMHSLLKRQIKRHFGDQANLPKDLLTFVNVINDAYLEFDDDRAMLERSLELSSQELLQSNSELRTIFQAIPDLFFRIDHEGKILNCTAGATTDLLLQPKELLGKRIQDISLKSVSEKFNEAIHQVQKSKSVVSIEYLLSIKNQNHFFEARFLPLLENQIIVIIRNITERKRAEQELNKREEAQRYFSERLTSVLYTINELSKIKSFDELSRRSVELALGRLGFDRVGLCFFSEDHQTLLGVYGTDETGHLRNEMHLKRSVEQTSTIIKLLEERKSVIFFKGEALYNDKIEQVGVGDHAVARLWNGKDIIGIFAVDNLVHQNPITDEDLKILDVYGTAMGHLFTSKWAEIALRESEQRFQVLSENSPVGIFQTDANGSTIYVNPRWCRISGMPKEKALGDGWLDAVHNEDKEKIFYNWKKSTQSQESSHAEYRFIHKDGTIAWVIGQAVPERNSENKIVGYVGTITDITERKKAEVQINKLNEELELRVIERTIQLEAANKELEAFAYSASHDLRAPLRAIDGFTHILSEDYRNILDEEGKRLCNVICNEAKRMGRLIDDLLSFSQISHADMQLVPINMEAMVFSVYYELTVHENRDRIDFHVSTLPSITGDPVLIREVWTNLISNAIKFSSKKERAIIEVKCFQDTSNCIYSIRDNGVGFNMEYGNKLFGVFQRLHSEEEFEGTGVGLAIVQRLIHRHGGKVWAEGEVDKGAAFYFTFSK